MKTFEIEAVYLLNSEKISGRLKAKNLRGGEKTKSFQ